MQSFWPLGLLLLLLPVVAPSGVHQLPLQLRHNFAAFRQQLGGHFRDGSGNVSNDHGKLPPVPISVSNMIGLASLGLLAVGTPEANCVVDFNLLMSDSLIIDNTAGGGSGYDYRIDVWSGMPQPVSLTFGGIDSHCRRRSIFYTNYVNISLFNYYRPWAFRMKAITIPGGANDTEELVIRVNAPAGIITFPFIIGPKKQIKRIAHRLGARASQEEDFENPIDCAKRRTSPPIYIHIGGKALKLTAKDYIMKIENDRDNGTSSSYSCYLAFQTHAFFGITFGNTWCVGTPLFNSNCLVLDFGKKRIGFAVPKKV